MTEQEVSVRLTENDERLYACAKRLEAVERRQDALDKLVTAVDCNSLLSVFFLLSLCLNTNFTAAQRFFSL